MTTQLELVRTVTVSEKVLSEVASKTMESWPAERLITWAFERFAPRIALSASFGSAEGMVILHLMHRIDPTRTRVFTIDTGRLPQETYNLMDRVRDRFQIDIEVYFPQPEQVQALVRENGLNLFYESVEKRRTCCAVRKVEPLNRALADLDAWFAGLRPEQGVTRAEVRTVEVDELHEGRIKINPLAAWTKQDVWSYVREHSLPVNALHAQGYPSVGCAPCSRAIREGEDDRAGRWWWEHAEERECGIHVDYEEQGSGI
jgi:thioredoxin-dependent adenylylsulfate APS reductase